MTIRLRKEEGGRPTFKQKITRKMVGEVPFVIAKSIDEEPDNWKADAFEMTHRQNGTVVWIANRDYGIRIYRRDGVCKTIIYGEKIGSTKGKRHVYRSVKRFLVHEKMTKEREETRKLMLAFGVIKK